MVDYEVFIHKLINDSFYRVFCQSAWEPEFISGVDSMRQQILCVSE